MEEFMMDELKLVGMSHRQKQILEAVKKMADGQKLYEEGRIEFEQLTSQTNSKPIKEVTQKVKKLITKPKKEAKLPNKTTINRVYDFVNKHKESSRHVIMDGLQMGWYTLQPALDHLVADNKIRMQTHKLGKRVVQRFYPIAAE